MRKTLLFLLFLSFVYLPLMAQLNKDHNCLRPTDRIVKQQVEFVEPQEAGRNKVWDFSRLKPFNDQYTLDYSAAPLFDDSVYIMGYRNYDKKKISSDNLIIGTEHYTMYYYQVSNDTLLLVGHENPVTKLNYTRPIALMRYPFNFGQSITSNYKSEGLYSGKDTIRTHGTVTSTVDAFGKMLLPDKDSLQLVLRTKTIQTIIDDFKDKEEALQMETYRWYLKGYRYPVFETVQAKKMVDNSSIFSTAFYFPPQEHLYIENDPENLAILEELWKFEEEKTARSVNESQPINQTELEGKTHKLFPNPVNNTLYLQYKLRKTQKVEIHIYSQDGKLMKTINKQTQKAGNYTEPIECANLTSGTYILKLQMGEKSINEKFIKK